MFSSARARHIVSQAKRVVPSRVHFKSDRLHDTFAYFDLHPNKTPVFFDDEKLISVELKWPYESGVVETENEIRIPTTSDTFYRLHKYVNSPSRFMVYIWYAPGRIGVERGYFTLSKPGDGNLFVLNRDVDRGNVSARQVADAVMSEVNTKYALDEALKAARCDFEEPLNMPSSEDDDEEAKPPPCKKRVVTPEGAKTFVAGKYNGHGRPTSFGGVAYKSLSEAKLALAFTALNIPFSYEVMSFARPGGGRYTPDFFLPMQQLIVEYKPARPLIEEELKCEELSHTGFRVVCVFGDCTKMPFGYESETRKRLGRRDYTHKDGLRGIAWHEGEKLAGEVVFVVGKSARKSPSPLEFFCDTNVPHFDTVCSSTDVRWNNPLIQSACTTVRDAC